MIQILTKHQMVNIIYFIGLSHNFFDLDGNFIDIYLIIMNYGEYFSKNNIEENDFNEIYKIIKGGGGTVSRGQ